MPYITPDRFRSMGFGVDLDTIEDNEFLALCDRASALVDSYCSVPTLPQKHDFRGGLITTEQHRWRLPDLSLSLMDIGTRRVYPYHLPVKTISSFKVMFTNSYSVEIDPSNLYVNKSEGWAEVISLAAVVTGIYPVGVNFGLYTPVAEVNYSYGWEFQSADEVLAADDGFTFRAANQFWLTSPAPVVKVNGVVVTTGFTINYTEGTVVFDALQAAGVAVTVSYSFTLPSAIRDATAHVMANLIAEREMYQRGMGKIGQMRIAELEIRRNDSFGRKRDDGSEYIPYEAQALLAPYVYTTVR